MGNQLFCDLCNQKSDISHPLYKAIQFIKSRKSFENILSNQDILSSLVLTNQSYTTKVDKFQIINKIYNSMTEIDCKQIEVKLGYEANDIKSIPQLTIIQDQSIDKITNGITVYRNAFYTGQFKGGVWNGKGVFYYFNTDITAVQFMVKGVWGGGLPLNIALYNQEATLPCMEIELINQERQAKITFPNKTLYRGSICLYRSHSIEQIMTGKGIITYPNKDIYIGNVKNGLMECEFDDANFISKKGSDKYIGRFKEGFRHGKGKFYFLYEKQQFVFESEWLRGRPVGTGKIKRNDNSHQFAITCSQKKMTVDLI